MQQALPSLRDRLTPAEEIFFTWLARVLVAAVLIGSAWIDDGPTQCRFCGMFIDGSGGVRVVSVTATPV